MIKAALLCSACGQDVTVAPVSLEDARRQEGVELAAAATRGDTALMSSIRGIVTDSPAGFLKTGDLVWRVASVEDVTRGVARSWSSVDARWIAIRLVMTYDAAETATIDTQSVTLREQLVLLDDEGGRHFPLAVHDRINPRIDLPWAIPRGGESATILFPIPRDLKPASLEISAPLGAGRIEWNWPETPSDWIVLNRKLILQDKSQRTLWDVTLQRVRRIPGGTESRRNRGTEPTGGDSSDSESGEAGTFQADLTLRNVTSSPALSPDPAEARLYTGGGRTIASVSLPVQRMVEPGKTISFTVRYTGVPQRESLEVVLPYRDEFARIDAMPGLRPEETISMMKPVLSGGLRVAVYAVNVQGGFGVRLGLLNNGSRPLTASLAKISGATDASSPSLEGVMEDAPDTLYPGFEERRWVIFPRRVHALRIEFAGKNPINVKL